MPSSESPDSPPQIPAAEPEREPDREAMPVNDEEPPRLPFPVVGVGASAGGIEAMLELLSTVRRDSGMAYVFVQHLPPEGESMLADILGKRTPLPVSVVDDGMKVEIDHLYVIRPGHTLTIEGGVFHLGQRLGRPMGNRPVDDFFKSLAREQRERAIAVVLSGMGSNGAAGCQAIKAVGGLCVAQEPETAQFPSMPRHLIDAGYADYILRPQEISNALLAYAAHPYARGAREARPDASARELQHAREILAILRTRTRQDFNGYKKPTILRRIQRRMGLHRVDKLADYARFLRQSPNEITALADDLLIHVTGFFRDPEAWEALRQQVVVPLVQAREADASIRCWVTACASGEEAYTLGMLLVEECERVGKRIDVKIFATDMADRTLGSARSGLYPGGIESDIAPERLDRFFQKEDGVYRVRQDLRERVVFAPQNVLQDPPFSRLDIVTCRNLLIYLEPEMQQRILGLLHFGLREGGTLFLGTSETTGSDELFESVDKKARIYRRIGPTRHGSADFPLPHPMAGRRRAEAPYEAPPSGPRPSLTQMTNRVLLEQHTPAAVTIDRDHRIVYYHGQTEAFVGSPRGEPTRDLMQLVRDGLRGAVRAAVHRALSQVGVATVKDGWIEAEPGRHVRVAVSASPLDPKHAPDHVVVSFQALGDVLAADVSTEADGGAAEELRRVRDELQSTIEELQTSNEELKASHEEVVSTNEELQSTNEELETSREEMQSLNEELSIVNAQLHAKMEEHQAAHSDLSSLLTSTDFAVLFLDTSFRIRRYTPQMRELMDVISTDIGRPVSALAKKFVDPDLTSDTEAVLTKLMPLEREIASEAGRWFLRRVTPYRTTDNHIDGVVVTFVDISARKQVEAALRESEARLRASEQWLATALSASRMGTFDYDPETDRISLGAASSEVFGLAPGQRLPTTGAAFDIVHPDDIEGRRTKFLEATRRRADYTTEYRVVRQRDGRVAWISERGSTVIDPETGAVRVRGIHWDVSERREAEQQLREVQARDAYLLELADALRPLTEPTAVQAEAARVLGTHLGSDRAFYAELPGDTAIVSVDHRSVGVGTIVGRHRLSDFGRHASESLRAGCTVVHADVGALPELEPAERGAYQALQIGAQIKVPLVRAGRLVAFLAVQQAIARTWSRGEVALVEETAERTWSAVERARAEARVAADLAGMTRLYRLNERLLVAGSLSEVLREILAVAVEVTGMDRGHIQLVGDARGPLRLAVQEGHGERFVEGLLVRGHQGPCEAALESGQRVVLPDVTVEPTLRGTPELELIVADGIRASQCTPLVSPQGRSVGLLTTHATQPHQLSEDQLRQLDLLSWTAAGYIERAEAEQALREGEERFRLLVEGARDFAMLMLDRDGRVTAWNIGAERLLGYTEAEAVGQDGAVIFTPEDQAVGSPDRERGHASETGQATNERWHVRKDGSRFWGSGVTSALRHPDGSLRGFVKILRDETGRKQVEQAQQAAREAAELANRMKDEFLAMLSHEVRTPLSSILLWSKMLHAGIETATLTQGLQAIRSSAEAQRQLIDDLLDTSRITSGKLRLEPRPMELSPVLEGALASVLPAAQAKGVAISTDIAAEIGVVQADPDRLRQVLWNLLSNAVKFTPAGGRVEVRLWRREQFMHLCVADTGGGIAPDFLPHLFEPFRQADSSSTTRAFGGLGLGLAICRKLVEQHGGTITAESDGRERGASFTVTLPLPALEPVRGAVKPASTVDGAPDLAGIHVLLVEDEPETREAIATLLRRAHAQVTAVNSVAAAFAAYQTSKPDLLVSDIGMPGEDGYSLMRRLRAAQSSDDVRGRLPALSLTAFVSEADQRRSLDAGFDRFLAKPIDPVHLLRAVAELAGRP